MIVPRLKIGRFIEHLNFELLCIKVYHRSTDTWEIWPTLDERILLNYYELYSNLISGLCLYIMYLCMHIRPILDIKASPLIIFRGLLILMKPTKCIHDEKSRLKLHICAVVTFVLHFF
jgi:hypothetical protein